MKVKELIEKLRELDQEKEILHEQQDYGAIEITEITEDEAYHKDKYVIY